MNLQKLNREIENFSEKAPRDTDYSKDTFFVMAPKNGRYAPFSFLVKKLRGLNNLRDLQRLGYICESYYLCAFDSFRVWFEHRFERKLKRSLGRNISIVYIPNNQDIFDAIEQVNKSYSVLRREHILLNSKNLPIQLGEWYAKCIFGLRQVKSTSQRGFDFYWDDERAEIKVHWGDASSPKGVKVRKALLELSKHCIVMYISSNFMIREICFLDSVMTAKKFSGKGHILFLKDEDIGQSFFSNSFKEVKRVCNSSALLKYASPLFAAKIAEAFPKLKRI